MLCNLLFCFEYLCPKMPRQASAYKRAMCIYARSISWTSIIKNLQRIIMLATFVHILLAVIPFPSVVTFTTFHGDRNFKKFRSFFTLINNIPIPDYKFHTTVAQRTFHFGTKNNFNQVVQQKLLVRVLNRNRD